MKFGPAKIVAGPDPGFNCVAWAAGVTDARWWPSELPENVPPPSDGDHWPTGCPDEVSIEAFVWVFSQLGYVICADGDPEVGFEKVAILANGQIPEHVMRQLPNGSWTSKLGSLETIEHGMEDLVGAEYGRIHTIMSRRLPTG